MSVVLKVFNSLLSMALAFLPDSPFRGFVDSIADIPYLGYLNYFIPVGDFISLLSVWTAAISLYYVVSAVIRTINAID